MIGVIIISISSYKYHIDIYKRLYDKEIEEYIIPNKDNIILFINDTIAIQLRSFLTILTNYYNSKDLFFILFLSGIFHISSIYHCIINILELFINNDKNKNTFFSLHYIFSGIPIALDIFLLCINSPIEISIPFLLLNITIALLFIVDPFYKLTHVAFHILLIIQNYYICLSSSCIKS
jgi:hypothetical protein